MRQIKSLLLPVGGFLLGVVYMAACGVSETHKANAEGDTDAVSGGRARAVLSLYLAPDGRTRCVDEEYADDDSGDDDSGDDDDTDGADPHKVAVEGCCPSGFEPAGFSVTSTGSNGTPAYHVVCLQDV